MDRAIAAPRPLRLTTVVLVIATMLASLFLVTLAAEPAAARSGSWTVRPEERWARRLMNVERIERGKRRMIMARRLVRVARRHSRQMAKNNSLYHNNQLPSQLRSYSWGLLGENVGVGASVKSLHAAFMKSRYHRQNVLRRRFDRVGVGVAYGADRMWITMVFAG